jgi:hypothetical protein
MHIALIFAGVVRILAQISVSVFLREPLKDLQSHPSEQRIHIRPRVHRRLREHIHVFAVCSDDRPIALASWVYPTAAGLEI